jgi:hypothetical protein
MPTRYAGGTDMTIRSLEWLPIDHTAARTSAGSHHLPALESESTAALGGAFPTAIAEETEVVSG